MTAEQILKNFYKEIENFFIVINEDTIETAKKNLAECTNPKDEKELRIRLQLLQTYLFQPRYFKRDWEHI